MSDKGQVVRIPEELYLELVRVAEHMGREPSEVVVDLIGGFVKTHATQTNVGDFPYSDYGE
ncbi:hypothetical protein [Infirmifilum sp. NZ]|uniref:hypothetical protein n=1 Tax=Infirmifilum sp. NZ TaxID=2926850 RepID=UPI00279920F7|nr:hypothetical protein [Infirmifilum sp. NZ]UNQ73626.1 hypothetical protein MOV14_01090 [Infirmifilum sp. NZ]